MKAYFSQKPEAIQYMLLSDKQTADVWLRKNISQETETYDSTETPVTYYVADEVYFRTKQTYDYIEKNFEQIYEEVSKDIPLPTVNITIDERMDALESAIAELAEVLSNG